MDPKESNPPEEKFSKRWRGNQWTASASAGERILTLLEEVAEDILNLEDSPPGQTLETLRSENLQVLRSETPQRISKQVVLGADEEDSR